MTIKEALRKASTELKQNNIPSSDLDSEVLLEYVLKRHGFDRAKILAYPETEINAQDQNKYFELIKRRAQREPVAYITKDKEFFGISFYTDKRVLIPRPETEILVEEALKTTKKKAETQARIKIIDIGTGSGCIAVTIQKAIQEKFPQLKDKVEIHASDISLGALTVAETNLKKHGLQEKIKLHQSDLFKNIKGKFDLICANLPYLSKKDYSLVDQEIKNYEPKKSLKGGDEGVDLYLKLFDQIPDHIKKEAQLLIEIHPYQKEALVKAAKEKFKHLKDHTVEDLNHQERVLAMQFQ
ncbi:peptide chain release factor N(5)-glutamine methyltransferase [Patescibacteria group bacterium]|nr:MAG: peptide chain release factor N(5)-glutamine methyltransferase [Patescibacteria group bacterium]